MVAAALSLLFLSVAFWSCFEQRSSPMDEGSLLLYPELVKHGAVPYRDFEMFYGPGNVWSLAAMYSLFGTNLTVERATGLLYRVLILLAIFCLAQRRSTTVAVGCTLLSGCMLIVTGILASAWIGAMACALWFVWIATAPALSLRRSCAAGLMAGLTLLFRVDLAPALLLATAPLWLSISWAQRRALAFGALLALLPLAFLTLLAGPEQVLNNLFIFPVLRSSPGRHLPLSSVELYLIRLFALHLVALLLNLMAGLLLARGRWREPRQLALLMATLLGAGITHQAFQRLDLSHMAGVAVLSFGTLPWSLAIIASRWRPAFSASPVLALASSAAIAAMISVIAPDMATTAGHAFRAGIDPTPSANALIEKDGRSFVIGTEKSARMIERMLHQLDQLSTPGQRLFVGPNDLRTANYCDTFLYHLMPKLRPATYFLEMNPFSANRPGFRLADDIATADFLILNTLWDTSDEQNRWREAGSDRPNEVVRATFEPVEQYGTYTLYRRKVQG